MTTITQSLFTAFNKNSPDPEKTQAFFTTQEARVRQSITEPTIQRFHKMAKVLQPDQELTGVQKSIAVIWLGQLLDYFCGKTTRLKSALERVFDTDVLSEDRSADATSITAVHPAPAAKPTKSDQS